MPTDEELGRWLEEVDWNEQLKDGVMRALAAKMFNHCEGEGSDDDDDIDDEELANAKRLKLVVVGDGAVGKTSLLIRFAKGEFPTEYLPTVFENYTAKHKNSSGETVLLHLWDTAGQEDYDRLRPLSYPGADIVLLCYNTISQASFEAIQEKWAPEIDHYIKDVPLMLVGTKVDLRAEGAKDPNSGEVNPVTTEEGAALAAELGAVHMEISAKTGDNLTETFDKAIEIGLAGDEGAGGAGAATGSVGGRRTQKKKGTCALV